MSPAVPSIKSLLSVLRCLGVRFLATLLLVTSIGGQLNADDWKSWLGFGQPRIKESKYAVPARLAVLWSPAMLNEAGKAPVRGFGGRIYFYDSKNKAISVEGQLVVYAYDNNKPGGGDSKVPDRKFCFTPEQFTRHYSPTEMGASYSIWLPWDEIGKPQADISLVPIFTSSSGALVMGQSSRATLPGPNTPPTTSSMVDGTLPAIEMRPSLITGDPTHRNSAVQQVAFQQQAMNQAQAAQPPAPRAPGQPEITEEGGVSTLSMTLPGTLSDRLAQAPPQISLLQKMAALRQEAMAKQAAYTPPSLVGAAGIPPASSAAIPPPGNAPLSPATPIPAGPPATMDPSSQRPTPQFTAWTSPAKATSPSWSPPAPTPQPARFSPPSQPALGGRSLPQVVGPPPSQPAPAEQPSYLPGSPQLSPVSSVRAPY